MTVIDSSLHAQELGSALTRSEVFCQLDAEARADLQQELVSVFVPAGTCIFRQDDPGDCLYLIARGRLRVVRRAQGASEGYTAELGPGDSVGELALLTSEPRTTDVFTIRDSHLARLSRQSFERLLQRHPLALVRALTRTSTRRLIATAAGQRHPEVPVRTLAIVPIQPHAPIAEFSERLARALATFGPTLLTSSARVDAHLGEQGVSQLPDEAPGAARVHTWLGEQELTHGMVVYQADTAPNLTAWTSRCLRQADYILLVGDATGQPGLGPLEIALAAADQAYQPRRQALVLIHPDGAAPNGTAKWLSERHVEAHHHVRLSSTEDIARVARRLTGQSVGLALGGGGARGFAHAGVIRALREANVPIDVIGGTSAGAVFAVEYALGWSVAQMIGETSALLANIADPTLPMVSLIAGRKGGQLLRVRIGDFQIEDLWLPFFCVSANISRGELHVHRSGSLAQALMASNAAPGIYPPVVHQGELLVDGALLDNVPVGTVAEELRGGKVIGVDVSPPVDLVANVDYGLGLSGWRVLLNRLNPFGPRLRVPSIVEILMRSVELGSIHRQRAAMAVASLYVRPPVEAFPLFDYRRGAEIAEVSYQAVRDPLRAWARTSLRRNGQVGA